MGTFRIDNKDPLYKKLIKLPTTYYRFKRNGNVYTIDSHLGTAEVGDTSDLKLRKQGDKIILHKGGSPLKLRKQNDNGLIIEENFVIEREAIIGEDRNNIIRALESSEVIKISPKNITDSPYFGIELYISRHDSTRGVLKSINFYDENDPVLQKIKKETGGLYFTIEGNDADRSRTIYISDKDGNRFSAYDDYQYQYTQNTCDVLTIDEIISLTKANDVQKDIIDDLMKTSDAQKSTIDNLKKANNVQQNFALQKGEKLSEDIYEANIVLNDKTIATLPKVGYYTLDDQLIIRNHVTKEEVVIPGDFHYLKIVKFGDNDYKLTFCNVLGNEFFEYKRYDPQYSNVSDEYKFISLSYARKNYNPSFGELLSHRPSFFIAEGANEPGSDKYAADVFELTPNGKGKKMATLIDEFGYFNQDGMFMHCNYHEGIEYHSDNPAEIEKKYKITDADSEFDLMKHNNITLHAIPQELF